MPAKIDYVELEPFGIELRIDCHGPFSAGQKDELRQLYRRDGLILVRGQQLSMAEQREFAAIFGPVLTNNFENAYVSNVRSDGILGTTPILFHNDVTFLPQPYPAASLHATEVGEDAAATLFASGMRAHERLSEGQCERIAALKSLQVRAHGDNRRTRLTDLDPGDMCTVHPVVGRQAGTGRSYIFVNPVATDSIIGLAEAESEALLADLFACLYAEPFIYRHAWRTGDIVVWDNLAVHHAREDASGARRTLQRVTIAALGYADQYPLDVIKIRDEKDTQSILAAGQQAPVQDRGEP
jgi:taurine dioxygenase